jgi:ABC-type multidrug transport system ATPase subunit
MIIRLEHIGKKFGRQWIFKDVQAELMHDEVWAILGSNGSGKSTLIQVLSGYLTPSQGRITWHHDEATPISIDHLYHHITLCAPYVNLYDDLTLEENVSFFLKYKKFRVEGMNAGDFADYIGLAPHRYKMLRQLSSGMKQRVKLGLAIVGDSSLLLLDEPTSHLDASSVEWYNALLQAHTNGRCVCIASNSEAAETRFATKQLAISEYKKV